MWSVLPMIIAKTSNIIKFISIYLGHLVWIRVKQTRVRRICNQLSTGSYNDESLSFQASWSVWNNFDIDLCLTRFNSNLLCSEILVWLSFHFLIVFVLLCPCRMLTNMCIELQTEILLKIILNEYLKLEEKGIRSKITKWCTNQNKIYWKLQTSGFTLWLIS